MPLHIGYTAKHSSSRCLLVAPYGCIYRICRCECVLHVIDYCNGFCRRIVCAVSVAVSCWPGARKPFSWTTRARHARATRGPQHIRRRVCNRDFQAGIAVDWRQDGNQDQHTHKLRQTRIDTGNPMIPCAEWFGIPGTRNVCGPVKILKYPKNGKFISNENNANIMFSPYIRKCNFLSVFRISYSPPSSVRLPRNASEMLYSCRCGAITKKQINLIELNTNPINDLTQVCLYLNRFNICMSRQYRHNAIGRMGFSSTTCHYFKGRHCR